MTGRGRQQAYTLIELVIVICILTLIAAVAVPGLSTSTGQRVRLAAEDLAAAIRFARSESVRTGMPHGFQHLAPERRLRVWRLDTSISPAAPAFDVRNPVDKQLYDYRLDTELVAEAATVVENALFASACSTPGNIYFDRHGTPWCSDPDDVLLSSYELVLRSGASEHRVVVDRLTGRVRVL